MTRPAFRTLAAIATVAALLATLADAQVRARRAERVEDIPRNPDAEPQQLPGWSAALADNVTQLIGTMQSLGPWEEHYGHLNVAAENVFSDNDWTTPEDEFTLTMIQEVSAVPPWDPLGRLDRTTALLSERYALNPKQEQKLRSLIVRESNEMFRNNMNNIMQYSVEAIQTRAAGEPFTKDQVQRWAALAKPVIQDAQTRLRKASGEFMQDLTPEQRMLVQRDLSVTTRRQSEVLRMADEWARGKWEPSDWGLQDDPIQMAGQPVARGADAPPANASGSGAPAKQAATPAKRSTTPANARAAADRRTTAAQAKASTNPGNSNDRRDSVRRRTARTRAEKPQPPDAWEKYVQDFINKYKLNDDQEATAWRIHRSQKLRADQVTRRYDTQIENLKTRFANDADRLKQAVEKQEQAKTKLLNQLFDQLKERLDVLPTRDQREAAGEKPDTD